MTGRPEPVIPPQDDGAGYGVQCPLCRLAPAPDSLRCPGCQEDLTPLVHLRLRGRLAYNEGLRLARAGSLGEAVGELERAVRLEPGLVVAWVVLGKAAARLGDRARAAAALGQALRLEPGHPGAGAALTGLDLTQADGARSGGHA
ncbi:tetratricopeptide repeat protein [Kitasatospora sp. NBC_00240]|uniref:tetratricopeptide repeat protein n=1 Tax=Kitasatospora sp. NBC_00240 TaxID=2903567 RepID=UPI002259637F|nr:tetratricopeptide repeat protein [Kitasatospora sp. NBC_00240]MCX5212360.1 tetratricopeptide repeat protein [Kitasatospora sp. NBC_00240]